MSRLSLSDRLLSNRKQLDSPLYGDEELTQQAPPAMSLSDRIKSNRQNIADIAESSRRSEAKFTEDDYLSQDGIFRGVQQGIMTGSGSMAAPVLRLFSDEAADAVERRMGGWRDNRQRRIDEKVDSGEMGMVRQYFEENIPGAVESLVQAGTIAASMGTQGVGVLAGGRAIPLLRGATLPTMAAFGASAAESSYYEARQAGLNEQEAAGYGLRQGAIEAGIMGAFSGLGKYVKGLGGMEEAVEKAVRGQLPKLLSREMAARVGGEWLEENLTTVMQVIDQAGTIPGAENEANWRNEDGELFALDAPMIQHIIDTTKQVGLTMGLSEGGTRLGRKIARTISPDPTTDVSEIDGSQAQAPPPVMDLTDDGGAIDRRFDDPQPGFPQPGVAPPTGVIGPGATPSSPLPVLPYPESPDYTPQPGVAPPADPIGPGMAPLPPQQPPTGPPVPLPEPQAPTDATTLPPEPERPAESEPGLPDTGAPLPQTDVPQQRLPEPSVARERNRLLDLPNPDLIQARTTYEDLGGKFQEHLLELVDDEIRSRGLQETGPEPGGRQEIPRTEPTTPVEASPESQPAPTTVDQIVEMLSPGPPLPVDREPAIDDPQSELSTPADPARPETVPEPSQAAPEAAPAEQSDYGRTADTEEEIFTNPEAFDRARYAFRDSIERRGVADAPDGSTVKVIPDPANDGRFAVETTSSDGTRSTKGDPRAGWSLPGAQAKAIEAAGLSPDMGPRSQTVDTSTEVPTESDQPKRVGEREYKVGDTVTFTDRSGYQRQGVVSRVREDGKLNVDREYDNDGRGTKYHGFGLIDPSSDPVERTGRVEYPVTIQDFHARYEGKTSEEIEAEALAEYEALPEEERRRYNAYLRSYGVGAQSNFKADTIAKNVASHMEQIKDVPGKARAVLDIIREHEDQLGQRELDDLNESDAGDWSTIAGKIDAIGLSLDPATRAGLLAYPEEAEETLRDIVQKQFSKETADAAFAREEEAAEPAPKKIGDKAEAAPAEQPSYPQSGPVREDYWGPDSGRLIEWTSTVNPRESLRPNEYAAVYRNGDRVAAGPVRLKMKNAADIESDGKIQRFFYGKDGNQFAVGIPRQRESESQTVDTSAEVPTESNQPKKIGQKAKPVGPRGQLAMPGMEDATEEIEQREAKDREIEPVIEQIREYDDVVAENARPGLRGLDALIDSEFKASEDGSVERGVLYDSIVGPGVNVARDVDFIIDQYVNERLDSYQAGITEFTDEDDRTFRIGQQVRDPYDGTGTVTGFELGDDGDYGGTAYIAVKYNTQRADGSVRQSVDIPSDLEPIEQKQIGQKTEEVADSLPATSEAPERVESAPVPQQQEDDDIKAAMRAELEKLQAAEAKTGEQLVDEIKTLRPDLEKPKRSKIGQKISDAAAEARTEAWDAIEDAFKDVGLLSGPPADPDTVRKVAVAALKLTKAGTLTFADFTVQAAERLGRPAVEKLEPYFRAAWEVLAETNDQLDAPRPVSEILNEVSNERRLDDRTGRPEDSEEPRRPESARDRSPGDLAGDEAESPGEPEAGRGDVPERTEDSEPGSTDARESVEERDERPGSRSVGDAGTGTPSRRRRAAKKRAARKDAEKAGRPETEERPETKVERSKGLHYRITDDDMIDSGGKATKFDRNIESIRTLLQIESEGRKATAEEQETLAKSTGWGQLAPYFFASKELADLGVFKPGATEWNLDALENLGQPGTPTPEKREDKNDTPDRRRALELLRTLPPSEYHAARRSIRNSHYTSPGVARAIWGHLAKVLPQRPQMRILEPSEGSGIFWGTMPEEFIGHAEMHGIDPDDISQRVARQLYQGVQHDNRKFEEVPLPNDYFDLIISNVPFAESTVSDPLDKERSKKKYSLHNYFFAKSADLVREGGVVAFITSHFTMDGMKTKAIREDLAEKGLHFVGAVRLPGSAFKGVAGTEVTTDVIILQKGPKGDISSHGSWITAQKTPLYSRILRKRVNLPINDYFQEHSEQILGDLTAGGTMRSGEGEVTVEDTGMDLNEALPEALARLPFNADLYRDNAGVSIEAMEQARDQIDTPEGLESVPVGDITLHAGSMWVRQKKGMRLVKRDLGKKGRERLKAWTQLRDTLSELKSLQRDVNAKDRDIDASRKKLNDDYDAFVKEYKPLNSTYNRSFFKEDWSSPAVWALEDYDDKSKTAEKSDIFHERTQYPYVAPASADNPRDATVISIQQQGGVDLPFIAKLLDTDEETAASQLGGIAFRVPGPAGNYELKEVYLSGNVREKLRAAEEAALDNPEFTPNVEALKEVIPEDIGPGRIKIQVGAAWIPPETFAQFADEVLGVSGIEAKRLGGEAGGWSIETLNASNMRNSANRDEYGVPKWNGVQILGRVMNSQSMAITVRDDDGRVDVEASNEATALARQKAAKIRDKFKSWLWEDDKRTDRLTAVYNEQMRAHVDPEFPTWAASLAGMADIWKGRIRDYQRVAAARIALQGNTLLAHVVGAGKTLTAITGLMEARRLGVWRKPVIVVPNHLLRQWGGDFLQFYPGAKILVAQPGDFDPRNRQRLFNRIGTGNWDAVIVPQSSFKKMPVSPQYMNEFFQQQVIELEGMIANERASGEGTRSATLKELEAQKDSLETRMNRMLNEAAKDSGPFFDELGIDSLVVDEAHDFKNLFFRTRNSRVPGITNTGNQKTFDMLMKTDWLNDLTGSRSVVFATGTPIANSMAEAWVMQRYLQPGLLKSTGAFAFDDWKSMFGEVVDLTRVDPIGRKYRQEERFNEFQNLPELRRMWVQTADIKMAKDLDLPRPKVKNDGARVVKVNSGPLVSDYMMGLANRAGNMPDDPSIDNILVVMNEGANVAIDMRLVEPSSAALPRTKLNAISEEVAAIHKNTESFKGTQIVWMDRGVPKKPKKLSPQMIEAGQWLVRELNRDVVSIQAIRTRFDEAMGDRKNKGAAFKRWMGMIAEDVRWRESTEGDDNAVNIGGTDDKNPELWVTHAEAADRTVNEQNPPAWNTYQELKDQLIALGVPEKEIAFIHDFDTPAKQLDAYARMNNGDIRVMLASTRKMGTGANVQVRLVANHHGDAPWRPADIEQRDGRIIRPGNNSLSLAEEAGIDLGGVELIRYVTDGTIDARYWQTLEDKAHMLEQFYSGDEDLRSGSDIGDSAMDYAEVKAAAASNPLFIEEVELSAKVEELGSDRDAFESDKAHARARLRSLRDVEIPAAERKIESDQKMADDFQRRVDALPKDGKIELEIDGETHHKTKDAAQALLDKLTEIGRTLQVESLDDKATNWAKDTSGQDSDVLQIGKVYGRKLFAVVRGGWINTETGETMAGNSHKLSERAGMTDDERSQWKWGFFKADFGFTPHKDQHGKIRGLSGLGSFSGIGSGNIQKLNNIFRSLQKGADAGRAKLEKLKGDIPALERSSHGKYERQDELTESIERLQEVRAELGGSAGDEAVSGFVMSQELYDHLGGEASDRGAFMAERTGMVAAGLGVVTEPSTGNVLEVLTGDPTGQERPPRPGMFWLEPQDDGQRGWVEHEDGKVFGQYPTRPDDSNRDISSQVPPADDEELASGVVVRPGEPDRAPRPSQRGTQGDDGIVAMNPKPGDVTRQTRSTEARKPEDETEEAIAAHDIARTWSRIFNVSIQVGGFNSKASGIYKWLTRKADIPGPEVVRTKEDSIASLGVLAHEIAHHLDNVLNVIGSMPKDVKKQVKVLDYESKGRDFEGWAEFIRMYVTEPDVNTYDDDGNEVTRPAPAVRVPLVLEWFENEFLAARPKLASKISEAREHAQQFANQSVFQRLSTLISDRAPHDLDFATRWQQKSRRRLDRLITTQADRFHPIRAIDVSVSEQGGDSDIYGTLMHYTGTAGARAAVAFEEGVRGVRTSKKIGERGLWSLKRHLKSDTEYGEANIYALARHTVFMSKKRPKYNTGMDLEDALIYLEQIEKEGKAERFEQYAEELAQFNNDLIHMLVDAGALYHEEAAKMLNDYRDEDGRNMYFPLHRVQDGDAGFWKGSGTRFVNLPKPVKGRSREGSGRQVLDPIDSTMTRTMHFYAQAAQQRVQVELAKNLDPRLGGVGAMGGLMDRVEAPMIPKVTASILETLNVLVDQDIIDADDARSMRIAARILDKDGSQTYPSTKSLEWFAEHHGIEHEDMTAEELDDAVHVAAQEVPDALATVMIWRPDYSPVPGKRIVRVTLDDGLPILYQMNEDLYAVATGMDEVQLGMFASMMRKSSRFFKAGSVALSTGFGAANLVRDYFEFQGKAKHTAGLKSLGKPWDMLGRYIAAKARGVAKRAGGSRIGQKLLDQSTRDSISSLESDGVLIRTFEEIGGKLYGMIGSDMKTRQSIRRRKVGGKTRWSGFGIAVDKIEGALEGLQNVIATTDIPPRLAEMEAAIEAEGFEARGDRWYNTEKGQYVDELPEHVLVKASTAAGDATINFKRIGSSGRAVDAILPFYNATIQATYRTIQQAHNLKNLNERDEDGNRTDESQQALRTLIYLSALATTSAMWWMLRHDDEDWREQEDWMRDGYWTWGERGKTYLRLPKPRDWAIVANTTENILDAWYHDDARDTSDLIARELTGRVPTGGGLARGMVETYIANYDYFRGRDLVPDYLQAEIPQKQFTPYTLETSKVIGNALGMSPIKVEHLLTSASGGMYRRFLDASEAVIENRVGVEHIPVVRAFAMNRHQAQSVNDFYTRLEEAAARAETEEWQTGKVSPESAKELARLKMYGELMQSVRKAEPRDMKGRRKFEWQHYLVGLARQALERDPLENNESPLATNTMPGRLRDVVTDFVGRQAKTAVLGDRMPQRTHKGDESYAESLSRWEAGRDADAAFLQSNRDSQIVRSVIGNIKNSQKFRDIMDREYTWEDDRIGMPTFDAAKESWNDHQREMRAWRRRQQIARQW